MTLSRDLAQWRRALAVAALVALVACGVGAWLDAAAFFRAWLVSWLFLLGIALASMAQVMIHEITGGDWGRALRPPLEAATATLPLVALLALPLAFGLPQLFAWARADADASSSILQAQRWYLSPAFFLLRNAALLLIWSLLGFACLRALRPDRTRARRVAVAGLLVYLVTVTLAAFDWIASLVPGFYSTAIGIRLGTAQFLGSLAFAVPFVVARARPAALPPRRDFQDFGNLLLTYAMMWAYIAFTQYLIVWGEDQPVETSWFWPRATTSWRHLIVVVVALEFALPVVAMLFRAAKRSPRAMAVVCALVLAGNWLDTLWLIAPSLAPQGFTLTWLDVAALVGMGTLWLCAVLWIVERLPPSAPVPSAAAAHG
jgi:hypothetical protein